LAGSPAFLDSVSAVVAPYMATMAVTTCAAAGWTVAEGPELMGPVPDGRSLLVRGVGEPDSRFVLSRRRRVVGIEEPATRDWRVQHGARLLRALLKLEFRARGALFLHGGMVRLASGDGIVLLGPKHSGKTSSILALLKATPAAFVSNDDVMLLRSEGGWLGLGWPRSIRVQGDALRALGLERSVIALEDRLGHPGTAYLSAESNTRPGSPDHQWMFRPRELVALVGRELATEAPVRWIVAPGFADGPPRLIRLAATAAAELVAASVQADPNKNAEFLLDCFPPPSGSESVSAGALAAEVAVLRLTQPFTDLNSGAVLLLDGLAG
jgi:hypothetical protein